MRNFETDVQFLKYRVLKEVAGRAYDGNLMESYYEIPKIISPGPKATMRCCIYKERAIAQERVRLAMGGDRRNPNVVEVIPIACDECPVERYQVSESCRGCISQRCIKNCPKHAITKSKSGKAIIDPDMCIECGRCAKVCPYGAITEHVRPCERSCKVGAIRMNEEKKAEINIDKCIACGACVYQCPFGAIMDKSFMVDAINIIRNARDGENYRTVAIVAPALAAQFEDCSLGQVVTGIQALGIDYVVEAAMGADMVADKETDELAEKGFLTSSCCPAFVSYIQKQVPEMSDKISHNLSPMAEIGRYVKINGEMPVKTIFIGPCTAKKAERQKPTVDLWIDCVLTFEELQAMLDAREIELNQLDETPLADASPWGRIFGRSGGLTEAVLQAVKEKKLDFEVKAEVCNGIEECKLALLKAKAGKLDKNFIEGMACVGGCVGGACSLNHEPKSRVKVDQYGKKAEKQEIKTAIEEYKVQV
ncbi:4Fe-4S dicluster domain-containing protein [Agathobaculum sp. NTUH-O15-33]|uniref:4Fe-4S dicluster domain-containing protein n=1 Tax=Agathobaculum sp. NTUH-O15-33 TaxID=3079302 RepID=UPI00295885E3|nr:4Fe-4S dicluster domain-containing protein [Agathobaculum sp. NTUH-O15-33]WNX83556.1 4Fe-4S dicluster domain-containing protein [Agathobaculum sp. NTUH-O15-33]